MKKIYRTPVLGYRPDESFTIAADSLQTAESVQIGGDIAGEDVMVAPPDDTTDDVFD